MERYEIVLGFNTKQYWIYDNENNVLIDPPLEVLEAAKDYEDQEAYIAGTLSNNPDWLRETDYWFDDDIDI